MVVHGVVVRESRRTLNVELRGVILIRVGLANGIPLGIEAVCSVCGRQLRPIWVALIL